jgi:hypothetical protein
MERQANKLVPKFLRSLPRSRNLNVGLLIFSMFVLSSQSLGIFAQYASKSLEVPIAVTGYIQSVKAFVLLGVLITLIMISQLVASRASITAFTLDIWVCRVSLCLLVIGAALLGVASSLPVLVLGKFDPQRVA